MRILIRASAFVAIWAVIFVAAEALPADPSDGANIGVGLIAFALVTLGAAVWGYLDGRRARSFRGLALVRLAVAAIMAVLVPTLTLGAESGFDIGVLLRDVAVISPFLAVLVAGPALVAGAVGVSLSREAH